MTKIFFGFGHGFGGTHLLTKLLSISPGVNCLHERRDSFSKNALFDRYMDVFHGNSLAGDDAILQERVPMVNKILIDGFTFGEINGILGFFIESLYKRWPNAKYIYMVRNPKNQVRTTYNTGIFDKKLEAKILKNNPSWDSVWWWPRPEINDPINKKWETMDSYEKSAWFWSSYNEFVLKKISLIPKENIFFYKFEDMIIGNNLNKLFEFLKIPSPTQEKLLQILSIKHAKTGVRVDNPIMSWENQTDRQKQILLKYVSGTAKKLNYEV